MGSTSSRNAEMLAQALRVDQALWQEDLSVSIQERNEAVTAAARDGWTEQEIAQELGVLPQDVHHWITGEVPPSR